MPSAEGGAGQASSYHPGPPAPIGRNPDEGKLKACFDEGDGSGRRFLDRFTYCELGSMKFDFYKMRQGAPPEYQGTTKFRYQVFAQGDNKDRRIRAFSRIVKGSLDYDWGPIDDLWVAPGINLSIMGDCREGLPLCNAGPSSVNQPSASWDNQDRWYHWDIYGLDTTGKGRDTVTRNRWRMEFDGGEGQGYRGGPIKTQPRAMRCDSADYFTKGEHAKYPEACVFPGQVCRRSGTRCPTRRSKRWPTTSGTPTHFRT
ncbi:hypothetical protein WKI71_43460 [Streptomyces sp. MS1.AVA.1]|uniref:Uncharacterized protein n=1 Tax=Streptomyces machairae TaxID=3134109 RepID=A0ABU8UUY9_9ACTN